MRKLQRDPNHVAETSKSLNIKLNPANCILILSGKPVDNNSESYRIFGWSLQFAYVHKDLGVYVHVNLRFHKLV